MPLPPCPVFLQDTTCPANSVVVAIQDPATNANSASEALCVPVQGGYTVDCAQSQTLSYSKNTPVSCDAYYAVSGLTRGSGSNDPFTTMTCCKVVPASWAQWHPAHRTDSRPTIGLLLDRQRHRALHRQHLLYPLGCQQHRPLDSRHHRLLFSLAELIFVIKRRGIHPRIWPTNRKVGSGRLKGLSHLVQSCLSYQSCMSKDSARSTGHDGHFFKKYCLACKKSSLQVLINFGFDI